MSNRRQLSTCLLFALFSSALLGQGGQAAPIQWRRSVDSALVEANRTGKLVLLHFYTSSCGPCKKLERDVFSQPQIAAAMERDYVPVKLNADESPAYANQYQITRVPSEVILTSQGNIVQKLSCPLEPDAYGSQLVNVARYYRQRSANPAAPAQPAIHSAYAGLKIGQPEMPQVASSAPVVDNIAAAPAVTNNPYITAATSGAPAPVVPQRPAAPTLPANAMPNSYRDRYAAVAAAPENTTNPMTQAPAIVAQASPVTPPVAVVMPVAAVSPVAVAPPAKVAPPIGQAPTTQATFAPPTPPLSAAAPPTVVDAWPPELPTGTPPLAFEGYCPVSLQQAKKWVRGNKTYGAIHRGRTYLFAGEPERQKFLAAPDAYSPVFSGNDAVQLLDENKVVAGNRKFGFEYRGAFYLFSSKETMARFASQPDHYSAGVRQAMNRVDAAGGTVHR